MPLQISLVLLCEMQQMQGAHGSAQMQVRASPKEKKNEKKKEKNWFEAYDCQCSWAKT